LIDAVIANHPPIVRDASVVKGFMGSLRPMISQFGLLPAAHCPEAGPEYEDGWGESLKTEVYLDIGVGQGHTTKAVAELLQAKQVWGLDVAVFPLNCLAECTLQYDGEHIPFPDQKFDVVSVFQVLHHVTKSTELLLEIKRVLKIGGSLLLKEHDDDLPATHLLILIEHGLYERRYHKFGQTHESPIETPVSLQSEVQWDATLKKLGFNKHSAAYREGDRHETDAKSSGGRRGKAEPEKTVITDPTRSFYARWIRS
jgi:SAM-dependent methyltransferase